MTIIIWPIVVFVLVLFFQDPIKSLLNRVKSVEALGFKGAFTEEAERARQNADAVEVDVPTPPDAGIQTLINQTASQPWWAVHQAYRLIRAAAREAGGGKEGDGIRTVPRVKDLRDKGLVAEDVYKLTLILNGLFYEMRKAPDQITPVAASDFVEAAAKLLAALQAVNPAKSANGSASPSS